MRRPLAGVLVLLAVLALAAPATADPQANAALTIGPVGVSRDGDWWSSTRLHLGARGDVLLGRKRNSDFGLGPYAELLTSFNDLQLGGGASALLPVHPYLPIVASAGGYARHADQDGWEPGVAGQVFWGSRSYNHRSWYVMAGGLSLQLRQGLGDSGERSVVIAAHLDGEVLLLPVLLAYEWMRGSPY